jgi:hypothetical protein
MPENIPQAIAEFTPEFGDPFVRRSTVRARVAPKLQERDTGTRGTQDVIAGVIHRPNQPGRKGCLAHRRWFRELIFSRCPRGEGPPAGTGALDEKEEWSACDTTLPSRTHHLRFDFGSEAGNGGLPPAAND